MNTVRDIIRIKRALKKLVKRLGALYDEYGPDPLPGSKAFNEQRLYLGKVELETPVRVADALIESAGDHIFAFCRCITNPAMAMAPFSCIRVSLEACAIALWLLDESISGSERLKRSFAYRYHALEEQRKCANSFGNANSAKQCIEAIEQIEKEAEKLGYPKLGDSKKRQGVGMIRPRNTDLIRDKLNKESLYRLTSALAHGHHWAFMALCFKPTEEKYAYEKYLEPIAINYLAIQIAHAFGLSVWEKAKLYGWDLNRLRKALDSAWSSFRMENEDYMFWKVT